MDIRQEQCLNVSYVVTLTDDEARTLQYLAELFVGDTSYTFTPEESVILESLTTLVSEDDADPDDEDGAF